MAPGNNVPTDPQPAAAVVPRRVGLRRLAYLFSLFAAAYLGVTLVLLALENSLVYHPVRASEDWLPPPNPLVRDVEFTTPDGTPIHAWWCPTERWEPGQGAALYCHGNAGNLSHRGQSIAAWQKDVGTAVLIFDYPGYGKSGGRPSEAGCYAAADAAYDWLTGVQGVAPQDVILQGGSLGGGVAVDVAGRRPHRALVLVSTFTAMPDVGQQLYPWLPVRWLMRNRFDSLSKIGGCRQPVLVAHGTADGLIPFSQGRRLFEAANEPKEFFAMEGCSHNEHDPNFYGVVHRFLARHAPAARAVR
jgi:fermentation-respiration switch protein FrsA (DUF1100 family)